MFYLVSETMNFNQPIDTRAQWLSGFDVNVPLQTGASSDLNVPMSFMDSQSLRPRNQSFNVLALRKTESYDYMRGMPMFSRMHHADKSGLSCDIYNLRKIMENSKVMHAKIKANTHLKNFLQAVPEEALKTESNTRKLGGIVKDDQELQNVFDSIPQTFQILNQYIGVSTGGMSDATNSLAIDCLDNAQVIDFWPSAVNFDKLWIIYRPTVKNTNGYYDLNYGAATMIAFQGIGMPEAKELLYIGYDGRLHEAPHYFIGVKADTKNVKLNRHDDDTNYNECIHPERRRKFAVVLRNGLNRIM